MKKEIIKLAAEQLTELIMETEHTCFDCKYCDMEECQGPHEGNEVYCDTPACEYFEEED